MPFYTNKQISRIAETWGIDPVSVAEWMKANCTGDNVKVGALLRIADATERLAKATEQTAKDTRKLYNLFAKMHKRLIHDDEIRW